MHPMGVNRSKRVINLEGAIYGRRNLKGSWKIKIKIKNDKSVRLKWNMKMRGASGEVVTASP